MGTFLKIVGIIAIVLLALTVVAVVFALRWLRKVIKAAADTPSCAPCRVHPESEPAPQWRTPAKINQYASEFRAAGFEEIGAFTIPEMQGLQMLAFVHPGERLYATIYDHKQIPPTFDIYCNFEDQTGLTAGSSKAGRTLDKRPGHPILWVADDRVEAVLDALKRHPQPAPLVPVSAAEFLPVFKKSYAEGMNWRLKKGVSRDEIRRQIQSEGKTVDEEIVNDVYQNMRKAHIAELQRGCLAQYLDDQQVPAAEWERVLARIVAIPETLEPDEIVEALEVVLTLDQEQRHALRQLRRHNAQTALDIMDEILTRNLAGLGLEKRGEVHEPVGAYVLLAPEREDAAKALTACT